MRPVYIASDNIISSLGFTTEENISNILACKTGILLHNNPGLAPEPFWASVTDHERLEAIFSRYGNPGEYTLFEKLLVCSAKDALSKVNVDISRDNVLLILSTTKGNIDLLDRNHPLHGDNARIHLWKTAEMMQSFFNLRNKPLVISNACISGVLAVIIGSRMIRSGKYDHVIVSGADLVTEFVLSGFKSFLSLCEGPCKPFDSERSGLSLGEAAGTLILTSDRQIAAKNALIVRNGHSSNDANHISGPSRTGEGLYIAIKKSVDAGIKIDYISAHGTATPYNDEMESIALTRAGLENVPVNSFKGYWGHTLGAAGIIEIAAGLESMRNNMFYKTLGYSSPGTSKPVSVIENHTTAQVRGFLKIASGFGGSNAALVITK